METKTQGKPKQIKRLRELKGNANYECTCVECGTKFQSNRSTAMYCSLFCKQHSTHKKREDREKYSFQIEDYRSQISDLNKQIRELKEANTTYKKDLSVYENEIRAYEKQLADFKNKSEQTKTSQDLQQATYKRLFEQYDTRCKNLEKINNEVVEEINSLREEKEELEETVRDLRRKNETLWKDLDKLEKEKRTKTN